jgi:hypothetical protein
MDRYWKVVTRTGKLITLVCGQERKAIKCPTKPFAKQLFMMVKPGQVVNDKTVDLFESSRLPKQH